MEIPANYGTAPGEEPRHYFRNICIAFKKTLQETKSIPKLQQAMGDFLNAAKAMRWHHKHEEIYRKDEGEKAMQKVWNEFKRYLIALEKNPEEAKPQDVMEAILEIERLIRNISVE
jgi:hypothetical protein